MRRMYREKKYSVKGTKVTFGEGKGPRITYEMWDLMLAVLFLQRKVLLISSVFCLVDIEKIRQVMVHSLKKRETVIATAAGRCAVPAES